MNHSRNYFKKSKYELELPNISMSESQECKVKPQKQILEYLQFNVIYTNFKNLQNDSYIVGGSKNWYHLYRVCQYL